MNKPFLPRWSIYMSEYFSLFLNIAFEKKFVFFSTRRRIVYDAGN